MSRSKLKVGDTYKRLTALGPTENKDQKGQTLWAFQCECDNVIERPAYAVMSGNTNSCGCYRRERTRERRRTHGLSHTSEYRIWQFMHMRCYNPNRKDYEYYGGRGIKVHDRWHDFETFYADLGPRPSKAHSIDRYPDIDGNYAPGNVRWATDSEQQRNTSRNRVITFRGVTRTLIEWSEAIGIEPSVIRGRIDRRGWSVEDALTKPPRSRTRVPKEMSTT